MIKLIAKKLITFSNILRFCKGNSISFSNIIVGKNSFGGHNRINRRNYVKDLKIGRFSFVGNNNFLVRVEIGSFCSLGSNIKIVSSTHPTKAFVSTHPFFYRNLNKKKDNNPSIFNEIISVNNQFDVVIGNDVWIGDNVLIKGGVTIGDGAIIAMGSVVTKDVEPFSIVGGVPAKEIKKRFSDDEIKNLIEIKWWNWDYFKIMEMREKFNNINSFLRAVKR